MALNYLDKAAWDAGVYRDKGNDDDTQQDTSSEDSGYSASGILSAAKNFLEHPFQGMGTVIAPNYTPRPLDDSVYSDIPGTPVASGRFGELEDESVRDERMKDSADYMAANWPRLYGGAVGAAEGFANVVGGIQNAVGGGNGILTNVQRAEEGMQNYRDQWNNEYGDSYFLNPNKFATDVGSGIGSTVPIMALSALMPGAAVAGGTRALTSALSRAGLGRLAMSKAGQALIADTVRSPISSLADSLSEYGTVVNDMMQDGMSEDEARRRAIPMFFKNMALDTFTVPLELGVVKGGKGIATSLLGRNAGEGMAKSIAKGAARTGMLAGASGLTEGYQEGAQNALENDVQGKRDGGWYNPFTWTNEDWEAARGGFVGGALMGIPGNVAAGFHPEAKQAPLSAEAQEQAQGIKDTLSHGKPDGMSDTEYNAYLELANSGDPALIEQAASSLKAFQGPQGKGAQGITGDAATEAYQDYETYDQKETIADFLDNNTVEQIGGEDNYNWLVGVLRNGTPEEVQKAYNDVIAAEKATAEQEAKNRPARSGSSVSPNTGNAMVNAVIQAANDSGVDPRLALAIAARESGGDDINAIHMPDPHDGIYGIMQAQDETVADLGLDSQYPDWQTDPYQNAMVGMAILKSKIANEDGDVWAGVRDYNGAGEEAEQYRQLVKNNYDNMGDIGSGNSWSDGITGYDLPTQGDNITAQVETLKPGWKQALPAIGGILNQMGLADGAAISSGGRTTAHNAEVGGAEHSYHINDDERGGGDAVDIVLPEGTTEEQAQSVLERFKATGAFKEVLFHDAGSGYHLHLGGYTGGLSSGGVSGKVTSDNGQFERELDQAAQEAKSDMDKIQAQSDQAMNEIMNDDSAEKTVQEAQEDAESAQKQAEESQQSAQDDVVPDVAQTIRDTSNNIDEINTLDGMFTKDSNGNDKFIDTPENRDFIKTNYKDEIAKAVNDAMSKKKAPSATPVPKAQQQTPHDRLGRVLSTYDRKDPKFKEYMNTFRNGTEQEQKKLADDLQTTQELERANSLKGNPLTTQQDQNIPQNTPQQAVEAPKQPEQVNTPVQAKESLETQKKRKIYLAKKQKLMERVPAGRTVKVHASTNDAGFDATYKIVPAGDITASHNTNYAVNDLYPAEYQPRDRNRPQMRGQVEKMTKGMKPELLAESQFVNEGAPVVNNSGVVLNGNGRVMAIQKAYKGLTDAHKKSAKAYKDYLVSIAPSLGIAPEKVQSMDHPVLVRQAADNADTSAIINSTEGGAKLGGAEQAKADADKLKLSTLEQFVDNGTGEFMNPSNREFRRAAASDVFSDAEGNSVFNEKGDLSPTGAFRIRNAIFAKAYNDNYLLTQLSEATDNNSKNIMNAMIAAAPEVAKVNEGIKNGTLYPDYDISDVIMKTAKTIMSLRNEGKPLSFHLQETDLFSQGESETERPVLEFIERNKFKSRTIADMYKGACDRIFAVGSPKQSKLFDSEDAPRISLENIISNAIQEVEHGQSLFDTTEEKTAEKAVSEVPDNRQAEPAGSGRVHQQEAGRVQSQEKEGNEVDEKSKQSNHVNAEPQQTESKDKESTHAEEGSQGDVQAQQDVNDAALSIGGKIFQLIERRKPRRYDKKAILHYLKSVYITPYEENGAYYIDIDNFEIEKTIKVSKKDYDYAVKYTKDGKWVGSYYQQQDNKEIKKAAPNDADIRFGTVEEAEARGRIDIAADDVSELFDRIEGMDMPERLDRSDEKKQASIRKVGQQLTRSKEDLKAEIKEAFPNAKEIKDEGERMTFTMPNGSHIVVDLKNEILLTDKELAQAKKDHHIDDNGNVIVEGYAEVHGKDAYMALAQGSREGIGFHEAYHLAEEAVLTDREKTAIKKAIPDAEKRADKYAEWVEARKHGRGTAWGKLFQKIKDFAAKMKKIFTGAETVNDIFRQIESGKVWDRNIGEQRTKQSNRPLYQAKHIVSTFADKVNLNRFVNAVLTHNEKSLIMHLGKVDADEAVAIKEATGYDVSNYEHVWRSNDVRHAQKRHGIDTETASNQIGLTPEEMVDALKVISAPDKIERGSINKEGPSIRYIKADNNGQLTIVEVVRNKRKTLDIKTMWKKRTEKLHGDYALQDTSETALDATSSTTENVAHNTDNVNGEWHYSIRKPKDAADEAQEKAEQAAEDTAVTMKDILAAARKILPIYTRSKIHYNSRATYRYDEHGRAGFVPSNYTLGDIGASIALHLDHVAQLKGANVELTNDVLDELEIEQRAAKKYKQEAPKAMTPVEARREGVKEFGRIYFQDPARAKEKYPKYYDIFEKTLDGMPEEKAAVEKILELEAQRAAQNPLLLATAGLSLADDRKKPKTVKERLNTAWARFYRTMVDETDPLRQITKCIEMELGKKLADEKDPHKRAVMCNSVAEGRASMLLFADNKAANLAYLNKIYKGAIRDKVTFEDVLNTLRKVRTEDIKKAAAKDVETYFGMYLVAQRTEEIVKTHKNYVRPEGYSHENCLRIIAEAPEAIRKAAQLYWKYNRNLVNIMEAEGLISEKQAAGLRKYEKYCPMYRDMSEHRTFDDELPTITAGRGFINQSSGIKKLKGGSILAVINPIDSMVSMTTALIARCERNDVAKVMVQSAEDHPGLGRIIVKDPSLFRADASKCAFTVMIAGKKTVYRTTPELYQALQEMSTNSAAFLTNVFGKFTDALRFGATNTPSFMVRNFIKDTLSASVNARYGKFVPIVDSIRGMKALKGDADFRAKFYGQGVPMDTYIRRDIRGAKQYKDKVQKSLKRYPLGIRQLMALSRSLVHKYNDVGEALEQGTRAGAMLNALKAGASDFEAGQEARDVTVNFSRHGSFGKKVNRYVPFFNASIQGTDKVIRTFLENPKRASLATCLYIILPTIILWAINHDDDWYKELDDNTKYTNWAVHIPGTDYHWLIPKPQEVGIGFGSGVEAVLNQMLNEDPHAMKAWARQFAEVVTPGIIMTALRPGLEWRYNYSEWTGRKLVPERLSKLPPEQQYTTATSELAKLMSQFAGKYVGLSPIAIDNFFSGWFGSLGRMSANALNKPIDAIRGSSRPPEPARYWYESPFIGSFARQDGQNSVYVERFYQLAEDMEMDYKRSDSYAKNKGKKGAPIPASLKAAQTCMKTMTKINKDIRSIKDDPKMEPETKRKRIDAAYTKMRTYAKKFVTQYDK